MSEKLGRKLTVLNKYGIYATPAALIVKTVLKQAPNTEVKITCGDATVDGRSIMSLLTIEASQGKELLIEAYGPEAREVIEAITELFNKAFFRDERTLPIPRSHSEWVERPG